MANLGTPAFVAPNFKPVDPIDFGSIFLRPLQIAQQIEATRRQQIAQDIALQLAPLQLEQERLKVEALKNAPKLAEDAIRKEILAKRAIESGAALPITAEESALGTFGAPKATGVTESDLQAGAMIPASTPADTIRASGISGIGLSDEEANLTQQRAIDLAAAKRAGGAPTKMQFVGFHKVTGAPIAFNPETNALEVGQAPEGVDGSLKPKTELQPSNIFVGQAPGGGVVTIPSRGEVTPTVTPLPGGGQLLPKIPEAIPESSRENVFGGLRVLDNLDIMEKNMSESGRIQGLKGEAEAFFGTNDKAIAFKEAENRNRADVQATIKGVPSNFDANLFARQSPALMLPEATNKARLEAQRRNTTELLRNTVAYWKSRNQHIPQETLNALRKRGIDPDTIGPWDGQGDPLARGELSKFSPSSGAESTPAPITIKSIRRKP